MKVEKDILFGLSPCQKQAKDTFICLMSRVPPPVPKRNKIPPVEPSVQRETPGLGNRRAAPTREMNEPSNRIAPTFPIPTSPAPRTPHPKSIVSPPKPNIPIRGIARGTRVRGMGVRGNNRGRGQRKSQRGISTRGATLGNMKRGNPDICAPKRTQMVRPLAPTMVALPNSQQKIKDGRKKAALEAMEKERDQKYRGTFIPRADPPNPISIFVPSQQVHCTINVYSKSTIDMLLNELLSMLIQTMKLELQGSTEAIAKEFYALYIPTSNTWCRPYSKASEYQLYGVDVSDMPVVQLRLKTKYKEEAPSVPKRTEGVWAKKNFKKSLANNAAYVNNRKWIPITLAETAMNIKAECDPSTTRQDILGYMAELKDGLGDKLLEFECVASLKEPEEKITIKGTLLQYNRIVSIEIRRVKQSMIVRLESGKEIIGEIHPDRTVEEFLLKVQTIERLQGDTFSFYLLAEGGGGKLLLDNSRTIRSYRFGPKDTLLLADRNNEKGAKLKEKKMLFIKVDCPDFKCNRTLKLSETASVAELIYRFSAKVTEMKDNSLYGVYPASMLDKQLVPVTKRLCDFRIPNMAELVIKKHGGKKNEIFEEKKIFGIEPREMNLVQADSERDLKVPDVLEELKRALFAIHGLDVENIFQKKGNQIKQKKIEEELRAELFPLDGDYSQYDAHDIASMIIEWFNRLPTPPFALIDEDDLAMCSVDEEECHYLPEKIREPHKSIFLWLLELMFDVVKNGRVNNMDIKSICGVFGAHMLVKPADFLSKKLQEQSMVSVLVAIMEGMGSDWGNGIHGGTMKGGFGFSSVGDMKGNTFLRNHLM